MNETVYIIMVEFQRILNIMQKLDDSAFLRTQSYITEICYFEYLLSLPSLFLIQTNINPN